MEPVKLRQEPLLTEKLAALLLNLRPNTLAFRRITGRYPDPIFVRIGRMIRYRLSDLVNWIDTPGVAPKDGDES